MQYSSINAISVADTILSVTVFDESDIDGTKRMIHGIYELFEKRVNIIMNKVPVESLTSEYETENLLKATNTTLKKPIVQLIPCYCDVLKSKRSTIFALNNPQHPFTKSLYELSEHLGKIGKKEPELASSEQS
jgi:septum site-determining protein MinD